MLSPRFQLLKILVGRDLTIRYKRSFLGIGWSLLNPILTSLVLWLIFSYVWSGRLPGNLQFAPYVMAGVLMMNFFNQGVSASAESVQQNVGVLTKISVPPYIFSLSAATANLINFMIGLLPLIVVCAVSGQTISLTLPLVVFVGFSMTMLVTGIGLALSILYIRFDDMRNIVNVFLMILMYFTPIFYPITVLSSQMQSLISLNPLNSYLEAFRWSVSKNATADAFDWIYLSTWSVVVLALGIAIFKRFWPRIAAML